MMFSDESIEEVIQKKERKLVARGANGHADELVLFSGRTFFKTDADYSIYLLRNNLAFAVAGFSIGLEKYYEIMSDYGSNLNTIHFGSNLDEYAQLIDSLEGKPIITHMQSFSGTEHSREGINWKKILISAWEEVMKDHDEPILHYLPARFNYWQVQGIMDQRLQAGEKVADGELLKYNYDYAARKSGYKPSPALHGVFEKELK